MSNDRAPQEPAGEHSLEHARTELSESIQVIAIGALAASIAHEVNQPLAGIVTNAGTCLRMLDADPPNLEGARETLRRTLRDANRASEILTQLRARFTGREFTPEPVNLNELIRDLLALSPVDLLRHGMVLRLELADTLPEITGDRLQLQQVIVHLLQNASDTMAEVDDRPRHAVLTTEADGHGHVRLTVRDSGVALSPKDLDLLFDPYRVTQGGGMVNGLFVSRRIVERHEGRLWAEPNEGQGTTFSFSLPLRNDPALS